MLSTAEEAIAAYGGRDGLWAQLAELEGVKLPRWDEPATPQGIWFWVVKLGVDPDEYMGKTGWERPESMVAHNPGRPLRAYVGEILELFDCNAIKLIDDQLEAEAAQLAETDEMLSPPGLVGLTTDFADQGFWSKLADELGADLPPWEIKLAEPAMVELLRSVKVSLRAYQAHSGDDRIMAFGWRNPRWPLRAWFGLVLEDVAYGRLSYRAERKVDVKSTEVKK